MNCLDNNHSNNDAKKIELLQYVSPFLTNKKDTKEDSDFNLLDFLNHGVIAKDK